jgi:hypothetical protein
MKKLDEVEAMQRCMLRILEGMLPDKVADLA